MFVFSSAKFLYDSTVVVLEVVKAPVKWRLTARFSNWNHYLNHYLKSQQL